MRSKHKRYYGLGMDALVIVCSRNTHVMWSGHGCTGNVCSRNTHVMWSGHGCTGNRMLSKQEGYHGLDMDALVTVCSGNTNVIMVWAWMCWRLCMDAQVEEWSPSSAERRKTMHKYQKIQKKFKSPGDLHPRHQLYSKRV